MNDPALLDLLGALDRAGYDFVPPTPLTHCRVLANGGAARSDVLRRLFGWSCVVDPGALPAGLIDTMAAAGVLEPRDGGIGSAVRVARLHDLFLHSAHPTDHADAVFLGPDSYRFARLLGAELPVPVAAGAIVDIGTGAGVGAMTAARLSPASAVVGTDINPAALQLARVNARHAGRCIEFIETDGLAAVTGAIDAAIANPPFLIDGGKRRYRDGGVLGTGVALAMAEAALARLAPGGRLILYTGSPIVNGEDALKTALEKRCTAHGAVLRYEEIDPDIFGEELERLDYAGVERIALVAAIAVKPF